MNVRKHRQHQCGLTNIDYRTKGDFTSVDRYQPNLAFAEVGTMNKANFKPRLSSEATFKDAWKTNAGWLPMKKLDPKTELAKSFYIEKGKAVKDVVDVKQTHSQLEKEAWTDKVFTGDNVAYTANLVSEADSREKFLKRAGRNILGEIGDNQQNEDTMKNATTDQTAQFTSLDASSVDLTAVKDMRRALRRKFASRSNLPRIFQQWDTGSKGSISTEDLMRGLQRMGISTSHEQCLALLASAKTDQSSLSKGLNKQEFTHLLFSGDESMNVNLAMLPAPTSEELHQSLRTVGELTAPKRLNLGGLTQDQYEQFRARNTWRYCLQKNWRNIVADLKRNDESGTYMADPNSFMKVITSRAKVPQSIKEDHMDMLYDYVRGFIDESSGKVDYQAMNADISSFNFDRETNQGLVPRSAGSASITSGANSLTGDHVRRNIFEDYTIQDPKSIPPHTAEGAHRSLVKVNRLMRSKFASRDAFDKALYEKADTDKNGNLSVEEFKAFVIETCREDLMTRKISKQDVEGFLSSFVYNRHGATDIKKVTPLVWEQDPQKFNALSNTQVRAVAPPAIINQELQDQEVDSAQAPSAKRLRDLLVEIEDKTFESKPKKFKFFREIDHDKDGFISYKDFQAHLAKNKIHATETEVLAIMHNVLDTERKGYIDFETFQKRMGPLMSKQVHVDENEVHQCNLVASQTKTEEYGERMKGIRSAIGDVTKVFRPDQNQMKLTAATRFGAKPQHKNTFDSFQQTAASPGFISEAERCGNRNELMMNTKVQFQKDEKDKKNYILDAKITQKRKRAEEYSARTNILEQELLTKDTNKLLRKAGHQDTYDKVTKMGGIY